MSLFFVTTWSGAFKIAAPFSTSTSGIGVKGVFFIVKPILLTFILPLPTTDLIIVVAAVGPPPLVIHDGADEVHSPEGEGVEELHPLLVVHVLHVLPPSGQLVVRQLLGDGVDVRDGVELLPQAQELGLLDCAKDGTIKFFKFNVIFIIYVGKIAKGIQNRLNTKLRSIKNSVQPIKNFFWSFQVANPVTSLRRKAFLSHLHYNTFISLVTAEVPNKSSSIFFKAPIMPSVVIESRPGRGLGSGWPLHDLHQSAQGVPRVDR